VSAAEFTEAEMATLQRFQAAAFAPEAGIRDMNPLVPSGEIRHAHEVVPEPDLATGTAAQWSTYFLAAAYAQAQLGRHLIHRTRGERPADPADIAAVGEAYARLADLFSLGFLFRHVSDEVARDLAEIHDTGEAVEVLWDWLTEVGIDPHLIKTAVTPDEVRAEVRRRQAERAS
jgi:hypothetical protein